MCKKPQPHRQKKTETGIQPAEKKLVNEKTNVNWQQFSSSQPDKSPHAEITFIFVCWMVAKIIASNWVSMPEWGTERDGKYISIFWNDLASIDPYHFFFPHFGLTYYQVEFNYLFSLLYVNIHRHTHTHTINDCEHHKNRPTDKPQTLNCLNM